MNFNKVISTIQLYTDLITVEGMGIYARYQHY